MILLTRSIIYLGCGSGLADPNFGKLLEWHRTVFPESGVKHFRLCKDSELEDVVRQHSDDNILAVSYGKEYSDLPHFVSSLVDASRGLVRRNEHGIARNIPEESRLRILASVIEELKQIYGPGRIPDHIPDGIRSATIAPILRPVPNPEYIDKPLDREGVKRLDPELECTRPGVTVVAGEEQSGLSTTLTWLSLRAAEKNPALTPILVDFNYCPKGVGPLRSLVVREALDKEVIEKKRDSLPPYVLAIDNYSPFVPKVSNNAISDIANLDAATIFLGCRMGEEADVVEKLRAVGVSPQVVYLGKLNTTDVAELARIVAPVAHEQMVTKIVSLLSVERLPRTPFTVSLLISILLAGEDVSSESSATGILEQYLSLLVGRGNPLADSRYSIGPDQAITALSKLAEEYTRNEIVYWSESSVLQVLERLKSDFAWPETASDMLSMLRESRILRVSQAGVCFARSSYLHLFAAKAATRDLDFRDFLMENILKFAPVIRHYAALNRRNDDILPRLIQFLSSFSQQSTATAFENFSTIIAPDRLIADDDESDQSVFVADDEDDSDSDEDGHDFLDVVPDRDRHPFVDIVESEETFLRRYMLTLETVSSILRDSDEVRDLSSKAKLLRLVLRGWSELIGLVEHDPRFSDLRDVLTEMLSNGDASAREEDYSDDTDGDETAASNPMFLRTVVPCIFVANMMDSTLSTRKLLPILDELLKEEGFREDVSNAAPAAILIACVGQRGWVSDLKPLVQEIEQTNFYRDFFSLVLVGAYLTGRHFPSEETMLKKAAVLSVVDRYKYKNSTHRQLAYNKVEKGITQTRQSLERIEKPEEKRRLNGVIGSQTGRGS